MLTVSNLSSNYGNIRAVRHVDLVVPDRGLVSLIGANGSGKSTTMKAIAGHQKIAGGTVNFDGVEIQGWDPYRIVRSGMCFIPERPDSILAPLTVEENLLLSSYAGRGDQQVITERVYEMFPRLKERNRQVAGSMSGGEQQMLAIARGLLTDPKLILIDSPVIGLAPSIVDQVYEAILTVQSEGVSILMIEQNAAMALVISDYAYVLHRGQNALEGTGEELRDSQEVVDAYLG